VVNDKEEIPCEVAVLAIGHSARDTFKMLFDKGVEFIQKPFSIGVRIEHPQELIDRPSTVKRQVIPDLERRITSCFKNLATEPCIHSACVREALLWHRLRNRA